MTLCRVAPAVDPMHAQCLMDHRLKIYHREVVHRHKPQCLLCLCKRPVFLDFCCLAHQPVNMPCKSGWPRWVCRIVGSISYPGILFSFACLRSSLCAIALPFTRHFVLRNRLFQCLQAPSVDNNRHVVLLPMQPHFCEGLLHS